MPCPNILTWHSAAAVCAGLLVVLFPAAMMADEISENSAEKTTENVADVSALQAAVRKSIPLLEAGSKGSITQRKQCFTCHNQGLVVLALSTAQDRGFAIDQDNLNQQVQFTADFLKKNQAGYQAGKGQGGAAMTAGYALWTLELAGWPLDETTSAVSEYLLLYQADSDHWKSVSQRPPSEQGEFSATWLALQGLQNFGTVAQTERARNRRDDALDWLLDTPATDTEDRVFRLWGLRTAGAEADDINTAVQDLLQTQQDDGGWAQTAEMKSDAYATATALVVLHVAGDVPVNNEKWMQGIRYLLRTQLEDGSWHVVSRSKPFQTHFESGYPHGKDQFISI